MTQENAQRVASLLIRFLETGTPPAGLFADTVFCDFTSPRWRLQAEGIPEVVTLRQAGHPGPGRVTRSRCDATPTGFVLEIEEEWSHAGESWYARELFRADVTEVEGQITALSVYCTGDWDRSRRAQHAREVRLLRP
ncbi:MAG TPA: hypothetical protein VHC69_18525 [Polyangiaceae bacterium]|nr:hypothetical protein [Polyangiaceae bacterium]